MKPSFCITHYTFVSLQSWVW